MDWHAFLTSLEDPPRVYTHKHLIPGWSPATFVEDQRGNDRVEQVWVLVLDLDDGGTIDAAVAAFGAWGGVLHTSYSHGATCTKTGQPCPPRVCFRVLLVLRRAVPPHEYGRLWAWAAAHALAHGLRVDPAPKAPGQFWYLPAVRPGAESSYETRRLVGTLLDPDTVLATPPPPSQTARTPSNDTTAPSSSTPHTSLDTRQARGVALLKTAPPAIQGQKGSIALMKVALALVRGLELPEDHALRLLEQHYNPRCQPPWSPAELTKKLHDAATQGHTPWGYLLDEPPLRSRPAPGLPDRRHQTRRQGERRAVPAIDPWAFPTTDTGNAERLVARHGPDLRYCHPWQKWLVWDGQRWRTDQTAEVRRRAKETARAIYAEAAAVRADAWHDDKQAQARRQELAGWARRTEAKERREALITLAQSEEGLPVLPEQLDADPWLFNCHNGTLNLRTGALRPHRREDLLTKLAPVPYDSNATCPTWLAFLHTIMDGNTDLIGFLQRLTGYALTGVIREHVLVSFYGTGSNGKSTFLETVLALVGDYGWQAPPDLLLLKSNEGHPTDLASLFGVRLATCIETASGRRLDEARMKQLTGGDQICARRMREDFWTFRPTHKLVLGTNHKPVMTTTDHGTWRRQKLVPFTITIPDDHQDPTLPDKLRAEWPGILRWAAEGCLQWQQQGLGTPHAIREATQAWRDESDALGGFLAACCEINPLSEATSKELYEAYLRYCETNNDEPLKQKSFSHQLGERGFEQGRTKRQRFWSGVRLRSNQT